MILERQGNLSFLHKSSQEPNGFPIPQLPSHFQRTHWLKVQYTRIAHAKPVYTRVPSGRFAPAVPLVTGSGLRPETPWIPPDFRRQSDGLSATGCVLIDLLT